MHIIDNIYIIYIIGIDTYSITVVNSRNYRCLIGQLCLASRRRVSIWVHALENGVPQPTGVMP